MPPPDPKTAKYRSQRATPRVHYAHAFEVIQAYTAIGMSAREYMALPGTPYWASRKSGGLSKCHVIVWYRYSSRLAQLNKGLF